MSVHNVTWSATASAVGSTEVIERAMDWFTGGHAEISKEKVKSYHGAKMLMIHARIMKKKAAKLSLAHLGVDFLQRLAERDELEPRIDEHNVLHIRLSLSSLASGSIEFSEGMEEQVKGRIKLEVYPGQDPVKNAQELLNLSIDFARNMGLPVEPGVEKFR